MIKLFTKYDYVFKSARDEHINTFNTKYIWLCWLQGQETAPDLVKACFKSVQRYHSDYKIKLLDLNSVQKYVEIPNYLLDKYKYNIINQAHFSDYIRVALLAKYGGTWIDATVFLSNPIPKFILDQDYFVFKFPLWCNLPSWPSIDFIFSNNVRDLDKRSSSNWFMHAKAGHRLIYLTKKFLEEFWSNEDSTFNYFMFQLFNTYAILKDDECKEVFLKTPTISNAYNHLLQQHLLQKFDITVYENIKKLTPVHKLTHKLPQNFPSNSFVKHICNNT